MDAFWHMLSLDLAVLRPMVRIRANSKCKKAFLARRSHQKYCESECARKTANLTYYHEKGADRRPERKGKERKGVGPHTNP